MKKIIIFLIAIIIFTLPTNTNAKETTFYEAEYIPNVWMHKRKPNENYTYYSQVRLIKETTSNKIAYCVEPFTLFDSNSSYIDYTPNFNKEQITDLTLISYFGYGYKHHTEQKWYAATQMLLWKTAEPSGIYYFSTTKTGPPINLFENEMNEIMSLVTEYKQATSFNNNTYYTVENHELVLNDTNNVLLNYQTNSDIATINNNTLTTKKLPEGTYKIILTKQTTDHSQPILFYYSNTSQNIIDTGSPSPIINELTINVIKTTVTVTKHDKETLSTSPQGDASLAGTIISLYKDTGEYIKDIIINENSTASIDNLPFGTYYLKEKTPGQGYILSTLCYYFNITKDEPQKNVKIYNEVIKGTVKIKKEYGYKENFMPEQNISFNIYNKNNELIKTITTNEDGLTEISLPYGKYKLTQLTTTEGYQKIEPIYFNIARDEIIYYHLKDYKIEVPNTKTYSLIDKIIMFIRRILCGKK